MKATYKLSIATALLLGTYSCKKGEASSQALNPYSTVDSAAVMNSDSISSAATMEIQNKQFIKTAEVSMEVKDVYDTTVSIEKSVQDLSGFVTHSNLQSNVVSEETYNTSNENAVLVKKYQTENTMQVRVPTDKLGAFLTLINDKKLFLNSRTTNAEDVTSNIKYAELENLRNKNTADQIAQMNTYKDKVAMGNSNMKEGNQQQLENMNIADHLKYSTVDIYIKEPKIRSAAIPVTNTKSIDDKYKLDFLYSAKSAFVDGFYLIQKIFITLITIWPLVLIAAAVIFFLKKRKPTGKQQGTTEI